VFTHIFEVPQVRGSTSSRFHKFEVPQVRGSTSSRSSSRFPLRGVRFGVIQIYQKSNSTATGAIEGSQADGAME